MRTAVQRKVHLPHTEKISCAFCKGTGKDPFGQLYPGSTCQVCSGRKVLYIQTPHTTCTYCHGSGVAFSSQNTCTVCHGHGVVSLGAKKRGQKIGQKIGKNCPGCGGTGMEIDTNLPCTGCHGMGGVAGS